MYLRAGSTEWSSVRTDADDACSLAGQGTWATSVTARRYMKTLPSMWLPHSVQVHIEGSLLLELSESEQELLADRLDLRWRWCDICA